jgi:subtilisin family serine protease
VALVLAGLAVVSLQALQSSAQTADDYYYFDGAPVPLVRSEREVVVRFSDSVNGLSRLAQQTPGLQRTKQTTSNGRRFEVVSLPAAVTIPGAAQPGRAPGADVAQLLETVRRDPNVVFAAPVYHYGKGGIRIIPTDEVIVRLKPGDTEQTLANIIDGMGLTIVRALEDTVDRFVLRMTDGKGPTALDVSRTLYETGRFEWAEPNFIQEFRQFDVPNDPRYGNQWHLKNTGQGGGKVGADSKLEQAWDIEDGNGSIVIAVIDSGVEIAHEDLAAAIFVNPLEIAGNGVDDDSNGKIDDVNGWDFRGNDNNPSPGTGPNDAHGTGAAGVAAARGNNGIGVTGACRQCRILPVKINDETNGFVDNSIVANAITYAARYADVINNSWGGAPANAAIQAAIADANTTGRGGKGIPVFFSSGNYMSGNPGAPVALYVIPGTYGFRFIYKKNASGAAGDDRSWISWVYFPGVGVVDFQNGAAGWATGGNQPWSLVTGDPVHSDESRCLTTTLRSGAIGNNQTSFVQVYKTVTEGFVLLNQWTSSEPNADGLRIEMDYGTGTFFDVGTFLSGVPGDGTSLFDQAVRTGVSYPAAHPESIAVGSSSNQDCRSHYSQFGPELAFLAPSDGSFYNMRVETTDTMGSAGTDAGNYKRAIDGTSGFGGTSSASPFAAGIAGLILSRSPGLTRTKVIEILKNSADKVGPEPYVSGRNDRYGHGRLNAYVALQNTPVVPGAPTSVVATPGNAQASVSFSAPANNGGSAITSYTVTSSPGGFTSIGATSPRVVTGLTNGVSYTFTVRATNEAGQGPASTASNSVIPTAGGAPGAFAKISPANGAIAQPFGLPLIWGTSSTATGYAYCIDTTNNNACDTSWVSTGTSTSVVAGGLSPNTTYYWQARSSNAGGTTYADGAATSYRNFTTKKSPRTDLNGDGLGDVFTYRSSTGAWARQISQPGGGFVAESTGSWDPGWKITPANFNTDAQTDFLLYNSTSGQWFKMLSNGTGFSTQANGGWWNGWERYVMDLDGDGISDVFLYDPATGVWFKAISTPTGFTYLQGGWNPNWEIYPVNLNYDALADMFLINRTTGRWFWVLGQAGAGFTYPVTETWFQGWQFYPGDFNGDGLSDILLHDPPTGNYFTATNNGSGFSYVQGGWSLGWQPYVADFNADGRDDLFLHAANTGVWFEMLSNGAGNFSSAGGQTWSLGWQIHPTDVNNDKRADIVLYDPNSGAWYQARNFTNGTFTYNNGTWAPGLSILTRTPIR